MSFTKMIIQCIRNVNDSTKDDSIRIIPVWTPLYYSDIKRLDYSITHSIPGSETASGNVMTTTSLVFGSFLEEYFSNLIKILAADTEPFLHIQVSIPGMPCVMLTPTSALTILPSLISELKRVMSSWPEEQPHTVPPQPTATRTAPAQVTAPTAARHLFFDEEDGRVIRQFY